jgi:hypothetical protein
MICYYIEEMSVMHYIFEMLGVSLEIPCHPNIECWSVPEKQTEQLQLSAHGKSYVTSNTNIKLLVFLTADDLLQISGLIVLLLFNDLSESHYT